MKSYLKKRKEAFQHAFSGLQYFVNEGSHAKIMLWAMVLSMALAWWLNVSLFEWVTIILCSGLVLGLEAMNSALEYLTDLASPEIHPLAKKAKDTAAGAVLIASLAALLIACLIFIPKLIAFFA